MRETDDGLKLSDGVIDIRIEPEMQDEVDLRRLGVVRSRRRPTTRGRFRPHLGQLFTDGADWDLDAWERIENRRHERALKADATRAVWRRVAHPRWRDPTSRRRRHPCL